MGTERAKEDEWFARNEKEMLEKARVAREKREHGRAEREALEERQRVKQLHFMKCPKCGHDLVQRDLEGQDGPRSADSRCPGSCSCRRPLLQRWTHS